MKLFKIAGSISLLLFISAIICVAINLEIATYVCFSCMMIILLISFILAIIISEKRNRSIKPINVLMIGIFLSCTIMFFPVLSNEFTQDLAGVKLVKFILISIHNAIRLFALDNDFEIIHNFAITLPNSFEMAYSTLSAILYILAPIMTFGFILSFFKNIVSYIRYLISFKKETYVFSILDEKSLALAKSIYNHHQKEGIIIFTGVEENDDNKELIDEAEGINAIIFKDEVTSVNFKAKKRSNHLFFFLIDSQNESRNIDQTLELVEGYRNRPNTDVFTFSKGIEGELIVNNLGEYKIKVRRINDVRSLIYEFLWDSGKILFDDAKDVGNGQKKISAVIVGLGEHGTEMLKAITWFCQMDKYDLEINAFDSNKLSESIFSANCPELMRKPGTEGVALEETYKIFVHGDCDVYSKKFAQIIQSIKDATYVFVSLGSDIVNIRVSVMLRMLFGQVGANPRIQTVVYDSDKKDTLDNSIGVLDEDGTKKRLKNHRGEEYNIEFIGDLNNYYCEEVLLNSKMDEEALNVHLSYLDAKKEGESEEEYNKRREAHIEQFLKYEYNYRSSVSSAIHYHLKVDCGLLPYSKKGVTNLTPEQEDVIKKVEHRRWNAYMRSEGFVYSGSEEKASRVDLYKKHNCLTPFDKLSDEYKQLDLKVGTTNGEENK